jgi:hypothetical protein
MCWCGWNLIRRAMDLHTSGSWSSSRIVSRRSCTAVDVIAEPVLKPGLRREVEKDRVVAF